MNRIPGIITLSAVAVTAIFASSASAQLFSNPFSIDGPAKGPGPDSPSPMNASTVEQINVIQKTMANLSAAQSKIESGLLFDALQWRGALPEALKTRRAPRNLDMGGRTMVNIRAQVSPDLLATIRTMGGEVIHASPRFNAVTTRLGVGVLEMLANRADVFAISRATGARTNRSGSYVTEGDTTHNAALARKVYGATGAGQTVGVLSDSDDYSEDAKATADLPDDQTTLMGQSGRPGGGEGTAMMEIIHDLAPDASILFATGFESEGGFADNILNLADAGSQIIVDDIGYFDEPPFQSGIIEQAVDTFTGNGGQYFSSAGNAGSLKHGGSVAWRGDFKAGKSIPGLAGIPQQFGTTASANYNYNTGVPLGYLYLWWADPLGKSTNNYDLYLLDQRGNVVDFSTTVQNGNQDPVEQVLTFQGDYIVVVKKGSASPRALSLRMVDLYQTGNRGMLYATTGNTYGHSAAANGYSVAAADASPIFPYPFGPAFRSPVETFSEDGPVRKFFYNDGTPITPGNFLFATNGGIKLDKPDITAADGVTTSSPGGQGFRPFYGTSAAAPHAAAITAQLLSAFPFLTSSEIRSVLTNTALDIEDFGLDINSGAGIVMSYEAIDSLYQFIAPKSVKIVNITPTTATIQWKTSLPADALVSLVDPSNVTTEQSDSRFVTDHQFEVTGLTPNTYYTFRLDSATATGSVFGYYESNLPSGGFTTKPIGNATIVVGAATGSRDSIGRLKAVARLDNIGSGTATKVTISNASISGVGTLNTIPIALPNIVAGQSQSVELLFPKSRIIAGSEQILRITGTFINATTGALTKFSGSITLSI